MLKILKGSFSKQRPKKKVKKKERKTIFFFLKVRLKGRVDDEHGGIRKARGGAFGVAQSSRDK